MAPKLGLESINSSTPNRGVHGFWFIQTKNIWRNLRHNINGATAIEYGLLAGLVAVGLAGGLGALADLVNLLFDSISGETTDVAASMADP